MKINRIIKIIFMADFAQGRNREFAPREVLGTAGAPEHEYPVKGIEKLLSRGSGRGLETD